MNLSIGHQSFPVNAHYVFSRILLKQDKLLVGIDFKGTNVNNVVCGKCLDLFLRDNTLLSGGKSLS